jgi:hypothetical protein
MYLLLEAVVVVAAGVSTPPEKRSPEAAEAAEVPYLTTPWGCFQDPRLPSPLLVREGLAAEDCPVRAEPTVPPVP